MAPLRPGSNATSEDCVTVGNATGATTNSTCPLAAAYDHEGAMKFVVTTILVYALLGTVTLLFMRIRRRANNMQKVMDTHDEHVQHYLREGGRLKAEGHRMKLRSEIRKFYSTVPLQQQHETHYQKKPWLRDLVGKPSLPRHDSLPLHVQHPQHVQHLQHSLRSHSQPCTAPQSLLRNSSDACVCEEHELQPLCGQAEPDSPVMYDLHEQPLVPSEALLDQSSSETDRSFAKNNSACGSVNKDSRSVQSPFSDLQVHQSAQRQKSVDSEHSDSSRHVHFSDSSPSTDSRDTPAGETGSNSTEVMSNSVYPNGLESAEERRESLVSFDGQDVRMTSLSLDDVSGGQGGYGAPGNDVVFSTGASMEPKLYSETGM